MATFALQRRRAVFLMAATLSIILLTVNLTSRDVTTSVILPLPGWSRPSDPGDLSALPVDEYNEFENQTDIDDKHPIARLMQEADKAWHAYEASRSTNFQETVAKYRERYGRHPPPGFDHWYKFARSNNVYNIDDFDQIMDDLRPFWGVEPSVIRSLAAHMSNDPEAGVSGLHIRDKQIWKTTNGDWRMEIFAKLVGNFVRYLPDMDLAMNRLDQPRVVVPWDDMQALLAEEAASRQVFPDSIPQWTKSAGGLLGDNDTVITDPEWYPAHGKQYMAIAKQACPPESYARSSSPISAPADSVYKEPNGGFVTNFNRSSDLCTIGPDIQDKHGFLFAPSTIVASKRLLPIFGECKINVNSDILFPANMYYTQDKRYIYDSTFDYGWYDKKDSMIWRGVTSGGTNTADNWRNMHRQRLVQMTNETLIAKTEVQILSQSSPEREYESYNHFHPSEFAHEHTDVGFTEALACVPDCHFYDGVWSYKKMTTLSQQFVSKFVIDVDGHSFSGRWHAFLSSKSLGIKSTIFREWHDSRLFAWRHFVPLDNRFDELYSILTYFIGLGSPSSSGKQSVPYIKRHDFEGHKLAQQGREWAAKVLRREDLEIYMFRLLIEYARIIDDNRDQIGYSGNGSELDKFDEKNPSSGLW